MSYTIKVSDVAISATGEYPQGSLTREMLKELADSYSTDIHKARVRIAHASEYQSRNIPEAPVFAYVDKLRVIDKGNRSFLVADLNAHEAFNKYKPLFPEYSIEFYDKDNPNNPTIQPHINKPSLYLKGVAMLGATPPAVKGLESVSIAASDYSDYRFKTSEFHETQTTDTNMDTMNKLKEMLKASDEQDVVSKVETLLAKSLDYEKMYSEATSAKSELEKVVEALEKEFADVKKKLERKEFEAKVANYDEKMRAKALEAFDARGKEFAEDLLAMVATLPANTLAQKVVAPIAEKSTTDTTTLAFKSYSDWLKASISYNNADKRKAYEFAEKHADVIQKWVDEKVTN